MKTCEHGSAPGRCGFPGCGTADCLDGCRPAVNMHRTDCPNAVLPMGKTVDGRTVVVCYCGGGTAHEWRPSGGGARILACPSDWPAARSVPA